MVERTDWRRSRPKDDKALAVDPKDDASNNDAPRISSKKLAREKDALPPTARKAHGRDADEGKHARVATKGSKDYSNATDVKSQVVEEKLGRPLLVRDHLRDGEPLVVLAVPFSQETVATPFLHRVVEALDAGVISEVHYWDMTSKKVLSSQSVLTVPKRHTDIHFLETLLELHEKLRVLKAKFKSRSCNPLSTHKFYYEALGDKDVILWANDRLLDFDFEAVPSFVSKIVADPATLMWSANVINNDVTSFMQQEAGVLPAAVAGLTEPQRDFRSNLWPNGTKAMRILEHYLANEDAYKSMRGTKVAHTGVFMDMTGFLGRNYKIAIKPWRAIERANYAETNHLSDRFYNVVVRQEGLPVKVDMGFVAVQGPRESQQGFEDRAIEAFAAPLISIDSELTKASRRRPMAVWSIFAGRPVQMTELDKYLVAALDRGVVDEVHLWDYSCAKKSQENHEFLLEFVERHPKFRLVSLAPVMRCSWFWHYVFYGRHLQKDDILLKSDDDTVYADISKLPALLEAIRAHPEINVWSANAINNDMCQYFQTQDGLWDGSGMSWGYPPGGGWGEVSLNAKNALKVHEYFLANADRFRSMEGIRPFGERISINFIGYSGRTAKIVSTIMKRSREVNSRDDEGGLTHVGNHDYGLVEAVFLPFVVAHGSFGVQEVTKHIFGDVAAMYREAGLSF